VRILMLTQWFEPEPCSKGLLFARALQDAGHEVEVITGFPNYPGGKLYPGYRLSLLRRQVMDDVRIARVPLFPSHDRSPMKRVLNYASFALAASTIGVFATPRPDVIYVYHPPLTTGLAAVALSLIKRAPFIYDIQDLWPDTLRATGMMQGRFALGIVGRLATFVYKRAAHIVVQSPGFERVLRTRGVPRSKIDVIYNWCDEGQLQLERTEDFHADLRKGEAFNVVFAGTMGKAQGLDTVLEAAALLQSRDQQIRIVLVGGGVEVDRLQALARSKGLANVLFLPRMPMSRVGRVLEAADVLLVHLKDDPLFAVTIPEKTQAYLSVGKPILMAVRGDASDLVTRSGGGVTCEPEDPRALADAISLLAATDRTQLVNMGKRGQAFYHSELSLKQGVARFIEIFTRVSDGVMR
jgi:colanic acid biosynthesis glycosyl transferase WcaI